MISNPDEYELHPLTVDLFAAFEANMEIFFRNEDPAVYEVMARIVHEIPDFEKGRVIIDLLILLATARRALIDHQLPKLED